MAAAYAYADGGQITSELRLLNAIDRFGTQAVLGRQLGAGEIRCMRTAENIVMAYRDRASAKNWATWAKENPELSELLNYAMMLYNDGDNS